MWGGDEACDHEFVDETIERQIRKGMGLEELSKRYRGGGKKHGRLATTFEFTRGYCMHCGAWRGAFGLEPTYQMFVAHAVEIGREIWRVLRDDGTFWLNLGDCYATGGGSGGQGASGDRAGRAHTQPSLGVNKGGRSNPDHAGKNRRRAEAVPGEFSPVKQPNRSPQPMLKPKDLVGIPWRVAFALQDDGWYLRQDIVWSKPNPMPESTSDRCTKAHEYLFLLTKKPTYFYDAVAIEEPASENTNPRGAGIGKKNETIDRGSGARHNEDMASAVNALTMTRNKRSVWTIGTQPFPEAHFATFPPAIVEPCVKAGTSERGCCPSCGRGWERVVAEVETGTTQKMPDGMATHAGGYETIHRDGREQGATGVPVMAKVTLGFYPACACARQEALPPYLPKPSRAKMEREHGKEAAEPNYRAAMVEWRAACKPIDERRRAMCEAALAEIRVVPAVVLDPFGGSGTTGMVARQLQRDAVLVEINPKYAEMAARRIEADAGMFAGVTVEEVGAAPVAKEAAE